MAELLISIIIILGIAFLFGEFCKLIRLPRMLGHLFVGILLGYPLIKDYLFNTEILTTVNSLAEIGIVLLFFFVGLNINLKDFKKNIKESALVTLFKSLLPLLFGFLISKFIFGFDVITSLIIGVVLSATSQVISINLLDELGYLKTKIGNLIITSGASSDVFELVIVSGILAVINLGGAVYGISIALVNVIIFVTALFLLRFAIFPRLLRFFEKNESDTSLFGGALMIAMITAVLSNLLGLGLFVGALFAGIVIRQILLTGKEKHPWEEHNMAKSIHTISFGFLVPIFFVVSGLKTDLSSIFNNLGLSLTFFLIAFLGTLGGSILGVILSKGSFREGLIVGFGSSPRGDLELVISAIALTAGLFNPEIFSAMVFMAFFTTLISPILFRYFSKKYSYLLNVKH